MTPHRIALYCAAFDCPVLHCAEIFVLTVAVQADDFGGMGGFGGGGGNSNPGSMQAGGDAPPMFPPLQFMNHERTAGLLDSAQQPQLPGRLLQVRTRRPISQQWGTLHEASQGQGLPTCQHVGCRAWLIFLVSNWFQHLQQCRAAAAAATGC